MYWCHKFIIGFFGNSFIFYRKNNVPLTSKIILHEDRKREASQMNCLMEYQQEYEAKFYYFSKAPNKSKYYRYISTTYIFEITSLHQLILVVTFLFQGSVFIRKWYTAYYIVIEKNHYSLIVEVTKATTEAAIYWLPSLKTVLMLCLRNTSTIFKFVFHRLQIEISNISRSRYIEYHSILEINVEKNIS